VDSVYSNNSVLLFEKCSQSVVLHGFKNDTKLQFLVKCWLKPNQDCASEKQQQQQHSERLIIPCRWICSDYADTVHAAETAESRDVVSASWREDAYWRSRPHGSVCWTRPPDTAHRQTHSHNNILLNQEIKLQRQINTIQLKSQEVQWV